jgi:peptidoglycan lytic transglycosylase
MSFVRAHTSAPAAIAVVLLALPAAGSAAQTGGAKAGDTTHEPRAQVSLSSPRALMGGRRAPVRGRVSRRGSRLIRIERRGRSGGWRRVRTVRTARSGRFRTTWTTPARGGRLSLRAVIAHRGASSSARRPSSRPRPVTVYRPAKATWYGPGFYGNTTACGQRLRRSTLGVAHRSLPCGTRVALTYHGRSIVVSVIDRGPYVRGVEWDLTEATARRVGMTSTSRLGALPLRRGA